MIYDHDREAWEQPGWTVAEHTNSPGFPYSTADLIAIHYTAMPRVPSDTASVLAAIQRDYAGNRGYSIGYSVAVDQAGVSWELRGVDYKAAANAGMNHRTFVILCLVDGADPANPAMVAKVRDLVAQFRAESPLAGNIVGHRDIGATACPGDGLYGQVTGDVFEPTGEPNPPTGVVVVSDTTEILTPARRLLDSRDYGDVDGRVDTEGTIEITVPEGGVAVMVTVTAVDPVDPGFVTLWPSGPQPTVSNLNYAAMQTIGNTTIVALDAGKFKLFSKANTHVIVDLVAVYR